MTMSSVRCRTGSPLSLIALAVTAACSSSTGPDGAGQEFVVEVTELELPERLGTNDTLQVRALGRIGSHGCFSLNRVESVLRPAAMDRNARLELMFIGRDDSKPGDACPAITADLDWTTLVMPPFDQPIFEVVVNQPDGERLQVSVPVYP